MNRASQKIKLAKTRMNEQKCFKMFKVIGSEGSGMRIKDRHGYMITFLSNNMLLMASREAKKVYLGVCVAPHEKTSTNTIYLSEAFSLSVLNLGEGGSKTLDSPRSTTSSFGKMMNSVKTSL